MMASRGMGAMNPKKMPNKKEITRTDDPNKVAMYAEGGRVKKMSGGGKSLAEKTKEQIAEYQNNKSDDSTENSFMPSINGGGAGDEYGVGMGGRASLRKRLNENTTVGAYLEGGAYKPKDGKAQGKTTGAGLTLEHRFVKGGLAKQAATAIAMKASGKKPKKMAEGGDAKSKVNEAGNYTKPDLRKRIFNSVKAAAIVGTGAGQWSARKAQVMAKRYKAAGGGYRD